MEDHFLIATEGLLSDDSTYIATLGYYGFSIEINISPTQTNYLSYPLGGTGIPNRIVSIKITIHKREYNKLYYFTNKQVLFLVKFIEKIKKVQAFFNKEKTINNNIKITIDKKPKVINADYQDKS